MKLMLEAATEAKAVDALATFAGEDGMVAEVFAGADVRGNAFRARLVDTEAGFVVALVMAPSFEVAAAWARRAVVAE